MADASILQEYLISLGYDIKEDQFRKFKDRTLEVGKLFSELTAGFAAATVALGAFADKIAQQFSTLYYEAQRTGETVPHLESLEYGFKAIGMSAEKAHGLVAKLATELQSNPSFKGFLQQMGVDVSGPPAQTLVSLFERLKEINAKTPAYARGLAEMNGIPYGDLVQITQNLEAMKKARAQFEEDQKRAGIDADKLASKSTELQKALNELSAQLHISFEVVAGQLNSTLLDLTHWTAQIFSWLNTPSETLTGAEKSWFSGVFGLTDWVQRHFEPDTSKGRVTPDTPRPHAEGSAPSTAAAAIQFFESRGWAHNAAAGIVANLQVESSLNPGSKNLDSDGLMHRGLASWSPERQALFARLFGHGIEGSSFLEQLAFVDWELRNGGVLERKAGRTLRATQYRGGRGSRLCKYLL